ncbi:hypothetical protein ACGC1H_000466 [Rhizoctonia solani]
MSPTPTTEYPSTTTTTHINHGTILAAAGDQLVATNISTGKKGLAGSVIAGAIIGGIVVIILIVALFFALRHRYRRSRGQTASTKETVPENEDENEKEKYAEANESSSGHCPASVIAYPSAAVQTQSDIVMCRSGPVTGPSSPPRSPDSASTVPTHINYSNITTHAPRPQSYQICPCPSCVLSSTGNSTSTGANPSAGSPVQESQIHDIRSYVSSASPPLPPGAMPPISSPTIESYQEQFRASPPPQSPSSPGGSSIRRWIMSPLSRSGTARTALPPYEQPASENYRVSDKKDESALAASVYAFM